jgi:hypothetical protein
MPSRLDGKSRAALSAAAPTTDRIVTRGFSTVTFCVLPSRKTNRAPASFAFSLEFPFLHLLLRVRVLTKTPQANRGRCGRVSRAHSARGPRARRPPLRVAARRPRSPRRSGTVRPRATIAAALCRKCCGGSTRAAVAYSGAVRNHRRISITSNGHPGCGIRGGINVPARGTRELICALAAPAVLRAFVGGVKKTPPWAVLLTGPDRQPSAH